MIYIKLIMQDPEEGTLTETTYVGSEVQVGSHPEPDRFSLHIYSDQRNIHMEPVKANTQLFIMNSDGKTFDRHMWDHAGQRVT